MICSQIHTTALFKNYLIAGTALIFNKAMDHLSKSLRLLTLALTYLFVILTPSKSESERNSDNLGFVVPVIHCDHPSIAGLYSPLDSEGGIMAMRLTGPLFMVFRIGNPLQRTLAVLDTGSHITWLQADPCEQCYDQGQVPHYDSRKSSTYRPIRCGDEACHDELYGGTGSVYCSKGDCVYHSSYGNGLTSYGYLGRDTFTFWSKNGRGMGVMRVSGVGVGRGIRNSRPYPSIGPPGVVGLSKGRYKFLDYFGVSTFSHCIPPGVRDTGMVRFGLQSNLTGQTIPLLPDPEGLYRVSLLGMNVGGVPLDIPSEVLEHGVLIDTGTTITRLHQDAFRLVLALIKRIVKAPLRTTGQWELCYDDLEATKDVSITFNFQGYAYELSVKQMWFKVSGYYCLACTGSDHFILGAYHMLDVNFGYDLNAQELYILKTKCELFVG